MKKLLVIFIIAFCSIFSLWSIPPVKQVFLQATQPGSIPMNPTRVEGGAYPFGPIDYVVEGWKEMSPSPYVKDGKTILKGQYSNNQIIATGGISSVQKSDFSSMDFTIHAFSDKGLFFSSQSSYYYRRPFELYIVPRVTTSHTEHAIGFIPYTVKKDYFATPIAIKEGSPLAEFTFDKSMIPTKEDEDTEYDIFFDVVLSLPGSVDDNNNLVDDKNQIFPLISANDYSSLVNFNMSLTCDGQSYGVLPGIAVPNTGYYDTPAPPTSTDNSISMYIYPSALSGSLNMKAYSERQAIADIEVLGINRLQTGDDIKHLLGGSSGLDKLIDWIFNSAPKTSYCVFLSSSPNPFKSGGEFVMKKDTLEGSVDIPLSKYNSIGFSVILADTVSFKEIKYTGVDKYDLTWTTKPTVENRASFPKLFIPDGHEIRATNSKQNNLRIFPFKGTAYLELDNNSSVIMEAGRYVGEVYVHVVNLL